MADIFIKINPEVFFSYRTSIGFNVNWSRGHLTCKMLHSQTTIHGYDIPKPEFPSITKKSYFLASQESLKKCVTDHRQPGSSIKQSIVYTVYAKNIYYVHFNKSQTTDKLLSNTLFTLCCQHEIWYVYSNKCSPPT